MIVIVFTVVDENANIVCQQLGDVESVREIVVIEQVLVDVITASGPLNTSDAKLVDDGGLIHIADYIVHVVAQRTIALLADVVDIDVTNIGSTNTHNHRAVIIGVIVVTSFNVFLAKNVLFVHFFQRFLVDQAMGVHVRSVGVVLDERIDPTVTNSNS